MATKYGNVHIHLNYSLRVRLQLNFNGSNPDGLFTLPDWNSFLDPSFSIYKTCVVKCIYVFMLLFSFSVFSDLRSLKIENENNSMKTLTAEAPYIGLESPETEISFDKYRNSPWLAGTTFSLNQFARSQACSNH